MKILIVFFILLSIVFCNQLKAEVLNLNQLNRLLNSSERQEKDSLRDDARKPEKILNFSRIAQGNKVLDINAGGGWYSELFSMAVGTKGKVYIHNDHVVWQVAKKRLITRTKDNRLSNIERFDDIDIVDINIPNKSIDIAFSILGYHDLFFTYDIQDGKKTIYREKMVDHKASLAKIKSLLKDDGIFVIIDHQAIKGSGYDAPNSTHRIDSNIVKYQMAEAGFQLIEEAFYLRNKKDNKNINVFEDETRGKTDRFIYKFAKQK